MDADPNSKSHDPALVAMGLIRSGGSDPTNGAFAQSWRIAWIALAVGIVAILVLFYGTASHLVQIWYQSATFNHGFLILPIVGYLIWIKRGALSNTVPRPTWWGVGVILCGGTGWMLGNLGSVALVQQFGLVIMLQGMFLAVFGFAATRVILFALLYLFFAVPAGEFLIPPLQDLTAQFVVRGLQLLGIPVFLDGIFISIPTGNFEVAEACSGVRFLIATVALGFLFGHLTYTSMTRKVLFLALSVVVPIVANGFRAFGIVGLAHWSDNEIAIAADHIIYGWVFFAFVTIVLIGLGMLFCDADPIEEQTDAGASSRLASLAPAGKRIGVIAVAALIFAGAAPLYAKIIASRTVPAVTAALPVPVAGSGWQKLATPTRDWSPTYPGAHARLFTRYRKGDRTVDLFIAYYSAQRQGSELIEMRNRMADDEKWKRASSGGANIPYSGGTLNVERVRMLRWRAGRIGYRWYWIGGQETASPYKAKALQAFSQLIGASEASAAIVVSTRYVMEPREADETLVDFLKSLTPLSPLLDRYSRASR
jgi:exosortase A